MVWGDLDLLNILRIYEIPMLQIVLLGFAVSRSPAVHELEGYYITQSGISKQCFPPHFPVFLLVHRTVITLVVHSSFGHRKQVGRLHASYHITKQKVRMPERRFC